MSAAIPTLGYPSRTAAVVALRAEGKAPAVVASLLGIPTKTVRAFEASARQVRQPHTDEGTRYVTFDKRTIAALAPAARQRGLLTPALIRRIIDHVIADGLVDAILDDGA